MRFFFNRFLRDVQECSEKGLVYYDLSYKQNKKKYFLTKIKIDKVINILLNKEDTKKLIYFMFEFSKKNVINGKHFLLGVAVLALMAKLLIKES